MTTLNCRRALHRRFSTASAAGARFEPRSLFWRRSFAVAALLWPASPEADVVLVQGHDMATAAAAVGRPGARSPTSWADHRRRRRRAPRGPDRQPEADGRGAARHGATRGPGRGQAGQGHGHRRQRGLRQPFPRSSRPTAVHARATGLGRLYRRPRHRFVEPRRARRRLLRLRPHPTVPRCRTDSGARSEPQRTTTATAPTSAAWHPQQPAHGRASSTTASPRMPTWSPSRPSTTTARAPTPTSSAASTGWSANKDAYNIRVLNLSFSAPPQSYYWDDPLNQAVMRAWQAGIVVVASAGNTGPDPMTIGVPGNVPYVITVGAMTDNYTPTTRATTCWPPSPPPARPSKASSSPRSSPPAATCCGLMGYDTADRPGPPRVRHGRRRLLHDVRHLAGRGGGQRHRGPDAAGRPEPDARRRQVPADGRGAPARSTTTASWPTASSSRAPAWSTPTTRSTAPPPAAPTRAWTSTADLAGAEHYGGPGQPGRQTATSTSRGLDGDGYLWDGLFYSTDGYPWATKISSPTGNIHRRVPLHRRHHQRGRLRLDRRVHLHRRVPLDRRLHLHRRLAPSPTPTPSPTPVPAPMSVSVWVPQD